MRSLFTAVLILSSINAMAAGPDQYPEDRVYTTEDHGYKQYGAPSIHKTGKYALTFDDGPHPIHTPKLLDVLKEFNVKVTFFVITSNIDQSTFPIIKRMLNEGHIVASHGLRHDNSNDLLSSVWKSRVKKSFQDLSSWYLKAGHKLDKPFYRFPYAAYGMRQDYNHMNVLKEISQELFNGNCIQFAFWDIDSGDWISKMNVNKVYQNLVSSYEGGAFITYKTIRNSRGVRTQVQVPTTLTDPTVGGVVLQHDIQPHTPEATKKFLKFAQANNIEIVRLDQVEEFKVRESCY